MVLCLCFKLLHLWQRFNFLLILVLCCSCSSFVSKVNAQNSDIKFGEEVEDPLFDQNQEPGRETEAQVDFESAMNICMSILLVVNVVVLVAIVLVQKPWKLCVSTLEWNERRGSQGEN